MIVATTTPYADDVQDEVGEQQRSRLIDLAAIDYCGHRPANATFTEKNVYCAHLCPHGTARSLVGRNRDYLECPAFRNLEHALRHFPPCDPLDRGHDRSVFSDTSLGPLRLSDGGDIEILNQALGR